MLINVAASEHVGISLKCHVLDVHLLRDNTSHVKPV